MSVLSQGTYLLFFYLLLLPDWRCPPLSQLEMGPPGRSQVGTAVPHLSWSAPSLVAPPHPLSSHHPPFFVQSTIFNPHLWLFLLLQALLLYGLCLSSLEYHFLHLSPFPFASQTPNLRLLDARHLDLPRLNPAVTDHNEFCEITTRPTVFSARPRFTSTPHIPPLAVDLTNTLALVYPVVAPPTFHPCC